MNIVQPPLFDVPAGSVRRSDPQTSHAAAAAVDVSARCGEVLTALSAHPDGAIPWELVLTMRGQGVDMDQNCVARRLDDLEAMNLVHRTGSTRPGRSNRQQTEWTTSTPGGS